MADRKQIIDERAAWAEEFRNAPTNAVTRMRRAADIAAAADQETIDDAAAFERSLTRDKGARDLFLGRERLNQAQQRIGQAERGMAQRQANFHATQERLMSVDEFNQNMRLRKAELDDLNSQRLMRKELRDADNAATILKQTMQAEDGMDELMKIHRIGSPEMAQGVLGLIAKNPMMDPKARASILATARIMGDPEELQAQLDAMPEEERSRTTVTRNDKGGLSITTRPATAAKPATNELDDLRRAYTEASTKRAMMEGDVDPKTKQAKLKPGFSEDDRLFYDAEKRRLLARYQELSGGGSPAAPTAPQSTTAPAPNEPDPITSVLVRRRLPSGEEWLFDSVTKQAVRKAE